jgi:CysZ protein
VLINVLVFAGAIWFGYDRFELWLDHLLPNWLAWLRWLLLPLFLIMAGIIVFYSFTLLANLLGAPFNGLLAEKIEQHLSPNASLPPSSLLSMAKDTPGMLFSELRKLLYLGLWALPLLLLTIIPGVNLLAPFAWALFSMWMMAIEYADYPMGNHGLKFAEEKQRLRQQRWLAMGFGAGVLLLTIIPVLNFVAMPVAVAGATAFWVNELKHSNA